MKTALQYLKVFGLLVAAFLAFGFVSCLMPDNIVKRHVWQSVHRGDLENDYPTAILPRKQCKMDNFTDAMILNQAYRMSKDSLLISTLAVAHAAGGEPSVDVLRNETEGNVTGIYYYPRYWHGSTFLTRILLMFGDYSRIRVILYILSTLLMVAAGIAVYRRAGVWPTAALLLALVGVNAYVMQFSIQFFPVLALSLMAIWILCRQETDRHRVCMLMFVIGALTAYFDLLTAPLMTLGLPLCFILWLMPKESTPKQMAGLASSVSALWFAGYAGSWSVKWLLATLLTPINVFADAYRQTQYRVSGMVDFGRFDAITENLDFMSNNFMAWLFLLFVVVMILYINGKDWRRALMFLCVAAMPYVWYVVVANHSYLHAWFTYRSQSIALLALAMVMLSMSDTTAPRWHLFHRKG